MSLPGLLATSSMGTASNAIDVPTDNYRRRLGMDTQDTSLGGDLLARGVGVLSDVGADILDVPMGLVNGVRKFAGAAPLQTFGSILRQNDGPAEASAGQTTLRAGQMPLPAGMTPSDAGAGRGNPLHPKRTDIDPSDPRLGPARDFSKELAGVPRDLPNDLRSGVIFKTKGPNGETIYSGRNVKAGADFVNGLGEKTGNDRGSTTFLPSEGHAADLRTLAILQAQNAAAAAAVPTGGVTDMGGGKGTTMMDDLVAKGRAGADLRGMSPRAQAHYLTQQAALDKQSQIAQMQNATALRGQDVGAATSRYGTDVGANVSMRGQDMHLRGQMLPLQMQQMNAMRTAAAMKASNGNLREAIPLMLSMGGDPSNMAGAMAHLQSNADATMKDSRAAFDHAHDTTGPDGKPMRNERTENLAHSLVLQQVPGFATMPTEQRAPHIKAANDMARMIMSADEKARGGLLQKFGLISPAAPVDSLPSGADLQGAKLRRGGWGDSLNPSNGISRNDVVLTTRDGREFGMDPSVAPESRIKDLHNKGVAWER